MTNTSDIREKLIHANLKITPQRLAVFEAIVILNNHPTADNIIEFINVKHPNIAAGTIYKTLETFVEKGLIKKVNTVKDIMRYDAITEKHHHIHIINSNNIEDYYDEELNIMLEQYFKNKQIPNFKIEEIQLQIKGNKIKE